MRPAAPFPGERRKRKEQERGESGRVGEEGRKDVGSVKVGRNSSASVCTL